MKTPLRNCWQWQGGEPCLNKRDEPRCTIMEQVTRWKRKNRIRQLKATIARQKKEYERLWESFSHMSKRCCELLYPTEQP